MLRRVFFNKIISHDGYKVKLCGRYYVEISNKVFKYYIFIEPLVSDYLSVCLYSNKIYYDKYENTLLEDEILKIRLIEIAREFLDFINIKHEVI